MTRIKIPFDIDDPEADVSVMTAEIPRTILPPDFVALVGRLMSGEKSDDLTKTFNDMMDRDDHAGVLARVLAHVDDAMRGGINGEMQRKTNPSTTVGAYCWALGFALAHLAAMASHTIDPKGVLGATVAAFLDTGKDIADRAEADAKAPRH